MGSAASSSHVAPAKYRSPQTWHTSSQHGATQGPRTNSPRYLPIDVSAPEPPHVRRRSPSPQPPQPPQPLHPPHPPSHPRQLHLDSHPSTTSTTRPQAAQMARASLHGTTRVVAPGPMLDVSGTTSSRPQSTMSSHRVAPSRRSPRVDGQWDGTPRSPRVAESPSISHAGIRGRSLDVTGTASSRPQSTTPSQRGAPSRCAPRIDGQWDGTPRSPRVAEGLPISHAGVRGPLSDTPGTTSSRPQSTTPSQRGAPSRRLPRIDGQWDGTPRSPRVAESLPISHAGVRGRLSDTPGTTSSRPQSTTPSQRGAPSRCAPPIDGQWDGTPRSPRVAENSSISHAGVSPALLNAPARAATFAVFLENVQLGRVVGTGSKGVVHLGRVADTGYSVAVKVITIEDDVDHAEISAEIRILQRLHHPNVISYLGHKFEPLDKPTKIHLFLEYLAGGSVSAHIKELGACSPTLCKKWTAEVTSGLAYLHYHKVVHRDLKGANVLLALDGQAKLADMGSAFNRQMEDEATRQSLRNTSTMMMHTVCGSIPWMAPEVCGGTYGMSADIWSLGSFVIEIARGETPWADRKFDNIMVLMSKIMDEREKPTMPESLPPEGLDFINACLDRNPKARWTSQKLVHHSWIVGK